MPGGVLEFSSSRASVILKALFQVCRLLKDIMDADVRTQYKIELAAAGMEDGPSSTLTSAERLRVLKAHQEAWDKLAWTSREEVPMHQGGVWELYGGVLAQGDGSRTLAFKQLPSAIRGIEEREWRIEDVGVNTGARDIRAGRRRQKRPRRVSETGRVLGVYLECIAQSGERRCGARIGAHGPDMDFDTHSRSLSSTTTTCWLLHRHRPLRYVEAPGSPLCAVCSAIKIGRKRRNGWLAGWTTRSEEPPHNSYGDARLGTSRSLTTPPATREGKVSTILHDSETRSLARGLRSARRVRWRATPVEPDVVYSTRRTCFPASGA